MYFSRLETRSRHFRAARCAIYCLSVFLLLRICAGAEVIDRIVAVVDAHVISLSDLRQEREIRMRLGDQPIEDDTALARELIDDYLIERQSADFPGVDVSPEEIDADLQNSVSREGRASQAIRDAVGRRIRMKKYFDLRFRQFIHPSDEDVRKYYDEVFVPAVKEKGKEKGLSEVPPFKDVTDAVRNNVIEEQLNHEIKVWLDAIRERSSIEIFQ